MLIACSKGGNLSHTVVRRKVAVTGRCFVGATSSEAEVVFTDGRPCNGPRGTSTSQTTHGLALSLVE